MNRFNIKIINIIAKQKGTGEAKLIEFVPNTAVFGPTNFIETTIASTTRMKISDEDFGWRFRLKISTVAGRGH